MSDPIPSPTVADAISELANALQSALPAAARLRQYLDAQTQDADTLADALSRAVLAIRKLQPSELKAGGAR